MNHPIKRFNVGTLTAEPGTRTWGYCSLEIDGKLLQLPTVIVHGKRPGPVLAVTAGIHGGEYVPMIAVRNFVFGLDPAEIKGTVIASLQASPLSFERRSPFVNPMDGNNLNRAFPGDPAGGSTEQLASWLWTNILSRGDYYVDCHSGDIPEALESFAGISLVGSSEVDEASREMADQFDVPRIVLLETEGSTVRAAAKAGIPSVLIEVGGGGRWSPPEVAIQDEGLRRIAQVVGVLDPETHARQPLPVFAAPSAVICEVSGLWFSYFEPGSFIDAGALLGVVEDPFGTVLEEARSPLSGVLIYGLSSLAANKGDLVACVASPSAADTLPGNRRVAGCAPISQVTGPSAHIIDFAEAPSAARTFTAGAFTVSAGPCGERNMKQLV